MSNAVSEILSENQNFDSKYFSTICTLNGIDVTSEQMAQLEEYVALLLDSNSKINLISRRDEHFVWRNHILHSVALMLIHRFGDDGSYVDVGTGGGLPGIPLAILNSSTHFTLCDSIQKKIRVVEEMRHRLKLENVTTIGGRVEEIRLSEMGKFDGMIARAVTDLKTLFGYADSLLRRDGKRILLAFKGGDITKEIQTTTKRYPHARSSIHPIKFEGEKYFEEQNKFMLSIHF